MTALPSPRQVTHPRELHTQLSHAVTRHARAVLEPGGVAVHFQELRGDELLVTVEGVLPPVGTPVTVGFGFEALHGSFPSEVRAHGSPARLALPTRLELVDRRTAPRYAVPASLGLTFHGQAPMSVEMGVQDLSEGGLAVTLPTGTRLPGAQHLLMGMLQTPGGRPIPVDLEIRNARPSRDGTRLVLGTRLAVIAPAHVAWYKQLVARCAAVA